METWEREFTGKEKSGISLLNYSKSNGLLQFKKFALEASSLIQIHYFSIKWLGWTQESSNKQLIWKKSSICGWNLQIPLITVSYMAPCNLRDPFLEAWKTAQLYDFWML